MAYAGSATVTVTLSQAMYINKIKVYPVVAHYTKFKVYFIEFDNNLSFMYWKSLSSEIL